MREQAVVTVWFRREITDAELAALEGWIDELDHFLPGSTDEWETEFYVDDWEPPDG
jgi:hypothetical protein